MSSCWLTAALQRVATSGELGEHLTRQLGRRLQSILAYDPIQLAVTKYFSRGALSFRDAVIPIHVMPSGAIAGERGAASKVLKLVRRRLAQAANLLRLVIFATPGI
jgi:hypothetical protein